MLHTPLYYNKNKYDDDSWWYSLLSSTPNKNTNHTTAGALEM